MKPDSAVAALVVTFGVIFIAFGSKNLIANPSIGPFSLASMAVVFGVLLSFAGLVLRRSPAVEMEE